MLHSECKRATLHKLAARFRRDAQTAPLFGLDESALLSHPEIMGEDKTPTTPEALEVTSTANVKVNVDDVTKVNVSLPHALPMHTKLAHALAAVVSGVIALFVSAVLADGKSVIQLKDTFHLPIVTNPALKADGFNHR